MATDLPAILTIGHLADMLSCDEETAASKLINGELPGLKFGRGWVVPTEALLQRINELALEEAAKRRENRTPAPAAPTAAKVTALPSMTVANSTTGQRGRTRRQPPDLSKYTQGQQAA